MMGTKQLPSNIINSMHVRVCSSSPMMSNVNTISKTDSCERCERLGGSGSARICSDKEM